LRTMVIYIRTIDFLGQFCHFFQPRSLGVFWFFCFLM
jgi:hypothetical protein